MANLYSSSLNLRPSTGNADQFAVHWNNFVEYVIDVTVEAYEKMHQEVQLNITWNEEQISAILADDYIAYISNSRPGLHLLVQTEVRIITKAMKYGQKSIRTAPRIDIKLFGSWQKNYNDIYFAWECKRIADRDTESNLISDYVSEGIFRFCDSVYASKVETAGMLGYIMVGEATDLAERINRSMTNKVQRDRILPPEEKLFLSNPRRTLNCTFISKHKRQNNTYIHLHHLFLPFNWIAKETPESI